MAGLLVAAAAFTGLMLLPADFPYWVFALIIVGNGLGNGLFASPNTSAIMSSVPPGHRGVASGMRSTFQNSGMSLSIGIFFTLMITRLAATLPAAMTSGLHAQGVPLAEAAKIAHLPPVSTLFAALLGDNPVRTLLAPTGLLRSLPARDVAALTGRTFFPQLIAAPFHQGLVSRPGGPSPWGTPPAASAVWLLRSSRRQRQPARHRRRRSEPNVAVVRDLGPASGGMDDMRDLRPWRGQMAAVSLTS